jgi:hypothetical protein
MIGSWLDSLLERANMSHEPGRERHMMRRCEHCSLVSAKLFHWEAEDEYWCASCIDNANEVAWQNQQERDLESPPESAREEQIRTWEEKQKPHRR